MRGSGSAFGGAVRKLRGQRELSLKQLAALTMYGPSYLALIERGERHPPSDLVASVDAALGADGALLAARHSRTRADSVGAVGA